MAVSEKPNAGPSPATLGARSISTTHWSLVIQAAGAGSGDARPALELLCSKYWGPLYRFARSRGLSQQDAEDLTQGFFEHLLEHDTIARADPARGRFRTFLLSSFKNFHSHQREQAEAIKRGGGCVVISIEAMREMEDAAVDALQARMSPELLYDRAWALGVIDHALEAVRRDYVEAGNDAVFDELKVVVWGVDRDVGYRELAERLRMTEGAVRVAVHRLRRRFRDALRTEVASTVAGPEEVEDEMRVLLAALGGAA